MIGPFRDNLAGTDEYGTYVANPSGSTSYSIPFSSLKSSNTLVLFTTGDLAYWLITTFDQAVGSFYVASDGGATTRTALLSSAIAIPCLTMLSVFPII
jgi:hypothetical protein